MKEVIAVEEIFNLGDKDYLPYLLNRGRKVVKIRCFDGEKETRLSTMIFAYAYFKFNKAYNVPVSVIQIPDKGDIPSPKLHSKLLRNGLKATYKSLGGKVRHNEIAEVAFDILEFMNNECIAKLPRYSIALDAEDLYDIICDPDVMEIKQTLLDNTKKEKTNAGKYRWYKWAWESFGELLKKNSLSKWRHNGYSQLNHCGSAKLSQINTGIIANGFKSDVNSDFISVDFPESYADGLDSPIAFIMECTAGAKAAMYQDYPMKQTEYLHRLVQMLVACFQHLDTEDCGSNITYPFEVTSANVPYIVGKYYMEDGVAKEILAGDNSHLIGRTLNFRNPAGCKTKVESGCCHICIGANSHSFGYKANLGHTSATKLMGTSSQKVLSVKHEDLGSLSLTMKIREGFKNYLELNDNGRTVNLIKDRVHVAIPTNCIPNLQYLRYVDSVSQLNITEFSKINELEVQDLSGTEFENSPNGSIGTQGEVVHLCAEFLEHFKKHPEKITVQDYRRKKYFFFDCTGIDLETPVFLAPFKHFDMLIQHKQTKRLFWSPSGSVKKDDGIATSGPCLTDFHTFGEAAKAALEVTREKLGINLSIIEAAIYPFTVTDPDSHDYRPVRGTNVCQFLPIMTLYNKRSLAAKLVSQEQVQVLRSSEAILAKRASHPYDDGIS